MSRSLYARLHRRFGPALADSERCDRIEEKLGLERTKWQVPSLSQSCMSLLSDTTVAVIGGGFAGLSAARLLCSRRVMVTVFEAGGEVGGRVRIETKLAKDRVIEAGAELIGANHTRWIDLAKEFSLGLTVRSTEDHYSRAGLELKIRIDKLLSRDEMEKLYDRIEEVLKLIGKDARLVKDPVRPWLQPDLQKMDKMSVADKLVELKIKKGSRLWKAMEVFLGNDHVASLDDQNYLALLCLVKAGQFVNDRDDPDLMGYWRETEVFRCADGNQMLAIGMAKALEDSKRCRIRRNTIVIDLDIEKRVTLKWKSRTKGKLEKDLFDYVVLAIPPSVWGSLTITPKHPKDTIGMIQMGPAVKYLSKVSDRFWIRDHAAPSGASTKMGQVWEATDNQTRLGEQGIVLTVFAGGRIPTKAEFQSGLKELYPKYKEKLERTQLVNWPDESFIKTGYSCPKKGQVFTIAKELTEPYLGRLFFAGEHTAMDFFGYMEGALRSGDRAANAVIARVCSQESAPLVASLASAAMAGTGGRHFRERAAFEREIGTVLGSSALRESSLEHIREREYEDSTKPDRAITALKSTPDPEVVELEQCLCIIEDKVGA